MVLFQEEVNVAPLSLRVSIPGLGSSTGIPKSYRKILSLFLNYQPKSWPSGSVFEHFVNPPSNLGS